MPSPGQSRRRVHLDGRLESGTQSSGRFTRRRKSFVLTALVPLAIVGVIATGIASASACEPQIEAGADCNGQVTFTAHAQDGPNFSKDERTNNNVEVEYSINGVDGPFESVESENGVKYAFNESNDFTFSDKFALPSNLKKGADVTVRAVTNGAWGAYGKGDAQKRYSKTTIHTPQSCEEPKPATPPTSAPTTSKPSVKIAAPTCANDEAKVTMVNPGKETVEFALYRDDASAPFMKAAVDAGATVSKEVSVDKSFKLSVKAPYMDTVVKQLPVPTGCEQPVAAVATATVTKVCKADASGWNVTFDNSKGTETKTFIVKSGDTTLDSVKVPAKSQLTNSYGFADAGVAGGASLPINVTSDGVVLGTQTVTNDCSNVAVDVKAECNTVAGSGAVLSIVNKGQVNETVTVARDGKPVTGSPFVVAPSAQATQKLLRMNEDETANLTIKTNSGLNVQKQVTLNCVQGASTAEVAGEVINRPQLADTGVSVLPLSLLGILLLATGGGLLHLRRWV